MLNNPQAVAEVYELDPASHITPTESVRERSPSLMEASPEDQLLPETTMESNNSKFYPRIGIEQCGS